MKGVAKMVMQLISSALDTLTGWFGWKSTSVEQFRTARSMVESDERKAAARKARVNKAVHEGDSKYVNSVVNGALAFVALCAVAAGCSTPAPVYVAADREVTCVTNAAGKVEYWKVPPVVMEELLNARLELGELKKESKVKEITHAD